MIAPISFFMPCYYCNWIYLIAQIIDLFILLSASLMLFDLCICLLVCSFSVVIIYCSSLQQIYEKIDLIIIKHKRNRRINIQIKNRMQTQTVLTRYHHKHVHSLFQIFYINRTLVSPLMLVGTLNILTINL